MILRALLLLVGVAWLTGCDSKGSVNSLYRFPEGASLDMKDVKVQVNVSLGGNALNDVMTLNDGSFLLNAYSVDSNNLQVEMAYLTGTPTLDLPVTLASLQTTFDVLIRLPADLEPGADGYALHFQLKSSSGTELTQGNGVVESNLDALKGAVQANTEPSANIVDLSLASTLAYSMIKDMTDNLSAAKARQSYDEIVQVLRDQQTSIEGADVDTASKHTVFDYIQGMKAALQNKVVTLSDLQSTITEKLIAAIDAVDAAAETARAEKVATALTSKLKEFAQSVKSILASGNTTVEKVFKADAIGDLPDPDTISTAVFSPKAVAFTDTDDNATLGGKITITAPQVTSGITGYNVYFGGSTVASRKTKLIGKVAAGETLVLTMAAGTVIPTGATMFWVYPVSNVTELDVPSSLTFVNLIVPKAPKLKAGQTYRFGVSAKVGDTQNMTNEGGGDLTSCDFMFKNAPAAFEVAVSADKTTCVIKVAYIAQSGVNQTLEVMATNAVGNHTVTATLIQDARLTAPNLVDGSITFANDDAVGTIKNVTNSGGGDLTSCELTRKSAATYFTVGISSDGNTCAIELVEKPAGTYQETIVIRAVNDIDDSIGTYEVTSNGPDAPSLRIFLSSVQVLGDLRPDVPVKLDLGGIESADAICNNDGKKLRASATYKALVSNFPVRDKADKRPISVRFACSYSSNECGPEHSEDWVLSPNTTYVNASDQVIGTTTSEAIFSGNLTNSVGSSQTGVWTGTKSDWYPGPSCYDFTDNTSEPYGTYGAEDATTAGDMVADGLDRACNTPQYLYCVEQPPEAK